MTPLTPWTASRIEQLTALDADGMSASRIARAMGGTSRNAVIGVINRRGLHSENPRAPGYKPTTPKAFAFNRGPKTPPVLPPPPPCAPDSLNLDIEQLSDRTCKWPYGERAPFLYCGCPPQQNSPWCPFHTKIAWAGKPLHARTAGAE